MSTETKKGRGKRGPSRPRVVEPLFICKTEMAQHLGVGDISTIDQWVAKGVFPPPHSRPGERFAVWLRKHWNAYVESGTWPKESYPDWKGTAS